MTEREFLVRNSSEAHSLQEILGGMYDVPVENVSSILDLGANIGSFAFWASLRWPGAKITCYEPHPDTFGILRQNAPVDALLRCVAVTTKVGPLRLWNGRCDAGESSLFGDLQPNGQPANDGTFVDVAGIPPKDLPPAEVLKLDTEGSEVDILSHYEHWYSVRAVMYEYHRRKDRLILEEFMSLRAFTLTGGRVFNCQRGEMKWVRQSELDSG